MACNFLRKELMMQGRIIKGIAGFYYVYVVGSGIYACKAKGIFRKEKKKPLVGDDVKFEITHEKDREGNIIEILPRKNELVRPAAANVGQALILFAMHNPEPNFMLLDRFLISMEQKQIPARICFNKADTATPEEMDAIRKSYENCGYPVSFISVRKAVRSQNTEETGKESVNEAKKEEAERTDKAADPRPEKDRILDSGMEEIRSYLKGQTTILAGPSGVGKSSLTNAVQDQVHMETGEISKKLARGKNTTRHAQLIYCGPDTFLFDTPGFSYFSAFDLAKEDLRHYYHEFDPYEGKCRFQGCVHINEPDCQVKEALEEGKISQVRYDSYRMIYEELKEEELRRWK